MAGPNELWADDGVGTPPRTAWSVSTESKLIHLAVAWESEDTLAADDAGGLSLIDSEGRLRQLTRGLAGITAITIAATGEYTAVGYGQKVTLLDRALSIVWSLSLHDRIVGLALDPFGRHLAVALGNRDVRIYTTSRRRIAEFEVVRPLRFLQFSATEPKLIVAAEDGLLAAYTIEGQPHWDMRLFATCGDMTASGDGSMILLAGFAHGVQRFDASGTNRGAFVVEGTPARISTCYDGSRIAAATLERQVFLLERSGNLRWAANAFDDVVAVRCDATGRSLTVGFAEGRVEKLSWR
ncbi:MAG: hypothetical protein H0T47_12655 [Planctomycetaceae bacterium]|nr:hypothetical protein [Planctomycetaceae bacterium]